jgi:hypothetical protein
LKVYIKIEKKMCVLLDNTTFQRKSIISYVKRGMNTVRSRGTFYTDTLKIQNIKELPVQEAQDLFCKIIDEYDSLTLKKYFGVFGGRVTWVNQVRRQYHTGTVSMSNLEISHTAKTKQGYLEKLGLVHYEKRGQVWFMILESPENTQLVPELVKVSGRSIDELYISSSKVVSQGEGSEGNRFEKVPLVVDGEKRERDYRVRERNRSSESEQQTHEETNTSRNGG